MKSREDLFPYSRCPSVFAADVDGDGGQGALRANFGGQRWVETGENDDNCGTRYPMRVSSMELAAGTVRIESIWEMSV